ncbi:hypothetical protein ACJX0J_008451, partial [Zea mays]
CSTILHTPLTTSLFLGLNQLDYTLNVFCSTILHTPLTTSLFLGLNQLDYTLNVFCSTILHTPLTTSLFLGLNQLDYTLNVFMFQNVLGYNFFGKTLYEITLAHLITSFSLALCYDSLQSTFDVFTGLILKTYAIGKENAPGIMNHGIHISQHVIEFIPYNLQSVAINGVFTFKPFFCDPIINPAFNHIIFFFSLIFNLTSCYLHIFEPDLRVGEASPDIKKITGNISKLICYLIEVPNSDLASRAFWVALKHLFTFSFTVFHHGNECARKALILCFFLF